MGQSVVNMLLCRLKGISPSEYDGAFLVYCIIHPLHQNWSPFPFGLGTVSSPGGFPGGGTEAWVRWTTTIRLTGVVDLSGRQTLLSHPSQTASANVTIIIIPLLFFTPGNTDTALDSKAVSDRAGVATPSLFTSRNSSRFGCGYTDVVQ